MSSHQEEQSLRITGAMNLMRSAYLLRQILEAIDHGPALALDLGEVTEFDDSGLRIVIMALRYARQQSVSVRLARASEPVARVLARYPDAGWAPR